MHTCRESNKYNGIVCKQNVLSCWFVDIIVYNNFIYALLLFSCNFYLFLLLLLWLFIDVPIALTAIAAANVVIVVVAVVILGIELKQKFKKKNWIIPFRNKIISFDFFPFLFILLRFHLRVGCDLLFCA